MFVVYATQPPTAYVDTWQEFEDEEEAGRVLDKLTALGYGRVDMWFVKPEVASKT